MHDLSLSVLFLTETWHDNGSPALHRLSSFYKFNIIDRPRARTPSSSLISTNHGGVAIITTPNVAIAAIDVNFKSTTFEYVAARANCGTKTIITVALYRTGPTTTTFFSELSDLISRLIILPGSLIIAGDVNIHVEQPDLPASREFASVLDSFGLIQHVVSPTHQLGGTIDVVITDGNFTIDSLATTEPGLSDHHLITWNTNTSALQQTTTSTKRRAWSRLDTDQFLLKLSTSQLASPSTYQTLSVNDEATLYATTITTILDDLIPIQTSHRRLRSSIGCFDSECRALRKEVRKFERRYRRSKNDANNKAWQSKLSQYRKKLHRQRRQHWINLISEERDPRKLWRLTNHIAGRERPPITTTITPNRFMDFFNEKVASIRASQNDRETPTFTSCPSPDFLSSFAPITPEEISRVIIDLQDKSSIADPIPVWLLKLASNILLPYFTHLFNNSLSNGVFPDCFKTALITPILKKTNLPPDTPTSFRPISNLCTISKIFEKIILRRLLYYLESNELMPVLQSAYRRSHSTETAMLKVFSDIALSLDQGNVSLLVSLDISAAFDTIDQTILTSRLNSTYAIIGTALAWLSSYLTNRTQSVVLNSTYSIHHVRSHERCSPGLRPRTVTFPSLRLRH